MKIPHGLFALINRIMVLLLRSPVHRLFSRSVLAIGYTGIRTGRTLWVPARYMAVAVDEFEDSREDSGEDCDVGGEGPGEVDRGGHPGKTLQVVTGKHSKWWPNFKDGLDVQVVVSGNVRSAYATAITNDPKQIAQAMQDLWALHPGDAAYMDVKMRNGVADENDFERAVAEGVLVRLVIGESMG